MEILVISGATMYINRRMPCPVDPVQAKSCQRTRRWSTGVFSVSAVLYLIGFYFAFIASHLAP